MRIIAPMMILIMMTSTLAGCTGGDPDGGGNDEIDMDILNQLIDDNLQDFINNTTITVENHYHNNTTYVTNEYNNMSNNEGDSVVENNFQTDYTNYTIGNSGNSSIGSNNELLFVMHMEFNASELAPDLIPRTNIDPRLEIFEYTKNFTGYVWVEGNSNENNSSNGWFEQAQISITHYIPCSVFYTFEGMSYYDDDNGSYSFNGDGTFWDYNWDEYRYYWASIYGWNQSSYTSNMTYEDYEIAGHQSESVCDPVWYPWVATDFTVNIGSIMVPQGYMITGELIEYNHIWADGDASTSFQNYSYNVYYDHIQFVRESGMTTNGEIGQYGGWENLTLMIDINAIYLFESSEFSLTILYNFTPVIPVG